MIIMTIMTMWDTDKKSQRRAQTPVNLRGGARENNNNRIHVHDNDNDKDDKKWETMTVGWGQR